MATDALLEPLVDGTGTAVSVRWIKANAGCNPGEFETLEDK